ncbi:ASCH domain-containing protein [Frateuria hangzhouensis]|uniref:ASCH domain-containing protein n=1 Tax=Frateuria hangzhouensis TaxID=2995589 RepID=UPI002260F4B4|nr:ASCH domain-containing protein [Frateuria sp. STR12]MCX7512576.1 ASCH domain-containing protein [Frateuria sp. STR12]
MKGLIIDEPWLGNILRGEKVWEMRTTATSVRGRIALIRKGSGRVVGVAELVDSIGPLDAIACRAHRDKHRIPSEQDEALLRWNHAWVLRDARPLVQPVAYQHPNGAVIWVRLPDAVAQQIVPDFGSAGRAGLPPAVRRAGASSARHAAVPGNPAEPPTDAPLSDQPSMVPVAKCGSWFGPHLARRGCFTIGAKGEEVSLADYAQALAALRAMRAPRWRRPNSNGNWGIVTGVRWCHPDELESF